MVSDWNGGISATTRPIATINTSIQRSIHCASDRKKRGEKALQSPEIHGRTWRRASCRLSKTKCDRSRSVEQLRSSFFLESMRFFFLVRARRVLFVFLVQRTHWFPPLARKKTTKKFQRKSVPLDKFAGTSRSTVLNSRRERDRLLDANNSIMETDGEVKFVSFKVVLGGRLHCSSKWITVLPVPIAWCVTFIGARNQLRDSSWWIQGQTSEEKSLKKFFLCDSCCGQTLILTEKKELEVLPSLDHSLAACLFAMSVSPPSLPRSGERESNLEKAAKEIKWTSFVVVVFSLHCKTVAC